MWTHFPGAFCLLSSYSFTWEVGAGLSSGVGGPPSVVSALVLCIHLRAAATQQDTDTSSYHTQGALFLGSTWKVLTGT